MSDIKCGKFGDIAWIGDSIRGVVKDELQLDTETMGFDAESFFKQKGILIVKVGNEDRPASDQDIKNVQLCLSAAFDHLPAVPFTIVTHHAIDFSIIPIEDLIEVVKAVGGENNENATRVRKQ